VDNEVKDVQFRDPELMAGPTSRVNPKYDLWDQCVSCGGGFPNLKKKPLPTCPQCMPEYIVTRQDDPVDELREFLQQQEELIIDYIYCSSAVYGFEGGMKISVNREGKLTFRVNQNGIASFTIFPTDKKSLARILHEIVADLEDWEGRVRQKITDGGFGNEPLP